MLGEKRKLSSSKSDIHNNKNCDGVIVKVTIHQNGSPAQYLVKNVFIAEAEASQKTYKHTSMP